MSIDLKITADVPAPSLAGLAQDLCNQLADKAKIPASLKSGDVIPGAKGDPITVGLIVLTFITSGAAVALINTLGTYFSRSKKLTFTLTRPDGSPMSLSVENFSVEETERTLEKLREFLLPETTQS